MLTGQTIAVYGFACESVKFYRCWLICKGTEFWRLRCYVSARIRAHVFYVRMCVWIYTRVGPKVSGLTYKSRAKWKMLRGIYSNIYGETILKNSIYIYIYWNIAKLFYFCHLKGLVRPETFGPNLVCVCVCVCVYTHTHTHTHTHNVLCEETWRHAEIHFLWDKIYAHVSWCAGLVFGGSVNDEHKQKNH